MLRLRGRYELSLDEFRGLYISDRRVDDLLRERLGLGDNGDPAARTLAPGARPAFGLRRSITYGCARCPPRSFGSRARSGSDRARTRARFALRSAVRLPEQRRRAQARQRRPRLPIARCIKESRRHHQRLRARLPRAAVSAARAPGARAYRTCGRVPRSSSNSRSHPSSPRPCSACRSRPTLATRRRLGAGRFPCRVPTPTKTPLFVVT